MTTVSVSDLRARAQSLTADWAREFPLDLSLEVLRDLALKFLERAPGSDLARLIYERDWAGVVAWKPDYVRIYTDVGLSNHTRSTTSVISEIAAERRAQSLFEKLEQLPLGIDKEYTAWCKFQEAEKQCRLTNERLRSARRDPLITGSRVASVLFTAQRKISRIVGDVPALSDMKLAFGPGASTSCKRMTSARQAVVKP